VRNYVVRRLIQAVPLLLFVVVFNFLLIHLAPGSPIDYILGPDILVSQEYQQKILEDFGLDQPLGVQLVRYLSRALTGDFGFSYSNRRPVVEVISDRVPATLLLVATGSVLALSLGVVAGVSAAVKAHTYADGLITSLALAGYSLPVFWLGMVLILVFALRLDLFPVQGMVDVRQQLQGIALMADIAKHMVLPVVALSTSMAGIYARLTRASMLEVLGYDYVRTARAKGLSERVVTYRHALRNALLPVVTIVGLNFGLVLTGAVLTETVFAWPGLGRLLYQALLARDYPVLMGMFLVVSLMVILAMVVTDLMYVMLNPRIRFN